MIGQLYFELDDGVGICGLNRLTANEVYYQQEQHFDLQFLSRSKIAFRHLYFAVGNIVDRHKLDDSKRGLFTGKAGAGGNGVEAAVLLPVLGV